MCNTPRYSESGACLGVQRCEEYEKLKAENARLREALITLRGVIHTSHVDMGGHHRYGTNNGSRAINAVALADNVLKEVG